MVRQTAVTAIILIFSGLIISGVSGAGNNACDFIDEARLVYSAVACGDDRIQPGINARTIEFHCREVKRHIERVRKEFVDKAGPFLSALRPGNLPQKAVYPFGGGDLLTALVTYPEATEITTVSLESAGDPRRLLKAKEQDLQEGLTEFRKMLVYLLVMHDSHNSNLRPFERGIIPGQLAFSLAAAAVYGYEPVSLKYFRIEPDGKINYFTRPDITSLENTRGKKLAKFWVDTDFSIAFRNMELTLKRKGSASGPEIIVHRHIAANLDNKNFAGSPLKKHLEDKGKISAMTKAGSYLLWFDDFSELRNYMLKNMAFMISDSTGILPRHAHSAGFEQTTYGKFNGAFLDNNGGDDAAALRQFWKSQPYRELPFRYGYSDTLGANHLIVTKPGGKQ